MCRQALVPALVPAPQVERIVSRQHWGADNPGGLALRVIAATRTKDQIIRLDQKFGNSSGITGPLEEGRSRT
jgi:hypothetical protein